MNKEELAVKIEKNKERLSSLVRKEENLKREIDNLEMKIRNQENYLSNMKE